LPVPEHQRVAGELFFAFKTTLNRGCKDCKVYLPLDYKIADDIVLQPDLLIVCGTIPKKYLNFPPKLVVEILSPSTMLKNRNTKFQMYETQGIKYYLIVDINKKVVEIFELVNGKYQLQPYQNNFAFNLEDDCLITPDLDNIWE
jgi:Uma2 family endonuclease